MFSYHKLKYIKISLFVFLICAFFYIFSVKPPYSSPDEGNHISRADALSKGTFLLWPVEDKGSSGANINDSVNLFAVYFGILTHSHDPKVVNDYILKMKQLAWSDKDIPHAMPNVGFYFPLIYTPQAVSLAVGKFIGMSVYNTYMLMNIATFAVIMLILVFSWRITPIPIAAIALMTMPVALFQIMSPTIDGLSMALSVLVMSLFVTLNDHKETSLDIKKLTLMLCAIFVVASSRANLVTLTLLPLYLYFRKKDNRYLIGFLIVTFATLAWTLYSIKNVHDNSMTNHIGVTNDFLMMYYIKHPLEVYEVIKNTLGDNVYLDFYIKSFIGEVAWLDAPIKNYAFVIFEYFLIIALLSSIRFDQAKRDWLKISFLTFLSLSSAGLIFLALLVQWSPFPAHRIDGIQGRYFFIPFIIFSYAFYQNKRQHYLYYVVLFTMVCVSLYFTRDALITRYF